MVSISQQGLREKSLKLILFYKNYLEIIGLVMFCIIALCIVEHGRLI